MGSLRGLGWGGGGGERGGGRGLVGERERGWWREGRRRGKGDARGEGVSGSIREWRGLVMGFPARAELVALEGVGVGE